MQAASAALRDLNGDLTHNIRAVERFITTVPGVGDALKAAFPLIGGLAFGAMIANLAVKFGEFNLKMREAPRAIQEGFEGLTLGIQTSTDELTKQADELDDKINRLLGKKPQNNAKLAIDDIKLAADAAASSALEAAKQVNALVSQNKLGFGTSLLSLLTAHPTATTNNAQGTITSWLEQIREQSNLAQIATEKGDFSGAKGYSQTASEITGKAFADLTAKAAEMRAEFAKIQASAPGVKLTDVNRQNELLYEGTAADLVSGQDHAQAKARVDSSSTRARELENARRLASEGRAASAKAQAELIKKIEDAYAGGDGANAGDKYLYYNEQASRYSGDLAARLQKTANDAYKDVAKAIAAQRESIYKSGGFDLGGAYSSGSSGEPTRDLSKDSEDERGIRESSAATLEFSRNLNALAAAQAASNFEARQSAIEIAVATGTMSRHDQAVALATLHTGEYRDAQKRLDEAMANVTAAHESGAMSTSDYNASLTGLGLQQQALAARYAIQHSLDDVQIDDTRLLAAWHSSLDHFVQESQDAAKQIGDIFTTTIGSVNETLSTTLTAHYHTSRERNRAIRNGLSDDVRGTASKLTNYGLQKAEGSVLGAFGFGGGAKPDGSQNNPLWVKMADELSSSTSGITGILGKGGGWLSKLFGGGSSAGQGSATDSIIGGFAGGFGGGDDASSDGGSATDAILAGFQGGFAGGGSLVAHRPALVGEMGPELFMPSTSGRVIPNNMLGATHHIHFGNIDARGASDPAAVDMAVRRGIERATPAIIAATEARRADQSRRSPLGHRR